MVGSDAATLRSVAETVGSVGETLMSDEKTLGSVAGAVETVDETLAIAEERRLCPPYLGPF